MFDRGGAVLKNIKLFIPNWIKLKLRQTLRTAIESPQYWLKRNNIGSKGFKHIIFVCQGNICRSAFAEYYLRSHVSDAAIRLESCGLDVHQNGPSPDLAIKVGCRFGVDLRPHLSKSYSECDFAKADLIVPMEYSQYLKLIAIFPEYKGKIHLLKDFAGWPSCLACNVYDPFGLDEEIFMACFLKVKDSIDRLPLLSLP